MTTGIPDWDLVKGSHRDLEYSDEDGRKITLDAVRGQLDDYIERVAWDGQAYPDHTFYLVALFPTICMLDLYDSASPYGFSMGTAWPMSRSLLICRLESDAPPGPLELDEQGIARVVLPWGELVVEQPRGEIVTRAHDSSIHLHTGDTSR